MRKALVGLGLLLCSCSGDDGVIMVVAANGYFEPSRVDFGLQAVDELAEQTVTLTNSSLGGSTVTEVNFDGDGASFSARLDGEPLRGRRLARGNEEISIFFGPAEERAYSSTMVMVTEALAIELEITGSARVVQPATPALSPSSITWPTGVELGRTVSEMVVVTNSGEREGTITMVRADPPFSTSAQANVTLQPGETTTFEARFRPSVEGAQSADVEVIMDSGASATLSLNGTGIRPANLTCQQSIDLGAVLREETAQGTLTCTADGPYTIAAANVTTGDQFFRVTAVSPPTHTAGTSFSIDVAFDAVGIAGERIGTLELEAAHGAVTSVELRGTVEAPVPSMVDLRIHLSWSAPGTDFDLHLVRAGASPFDNTNDCYWARKTLDWGTANDTSDNPYLDTDAISGPGEEELNLAVANDGPYDCYVMYYGDANFVGLATIDIEYNLDGGPTQSVSHQMMNCGNMWHVGTFDFTGTPTFTGTQNEISDYADRTTMCR